VTAAEAKRLALVLSAVVNAIEDGSQRSEGLRAPTSGPWLQGYADGWAAAVTIAKVTSAQAIASAREYESAMSKPTAINID
jgi:hypothetical protein